MDQFFKNIKANLDAAGELPKVKTEAELLREKVQASLSKQAEDETLGVEDAMDAWLKDAGWEARGNNIDKFDDAEHAENWLRENPHVDYNGPDVSRKELSERLYNYMLSDDMKDVSPEEVTGWTGQGEFLG